MRYPSYLMHFNRNHGKKNGQFVSGDGDGDGVSNDRYNYKDNRKGQTKGSVIVKSGTGGSGSSSSSDSSGSSGKKIVERGGVRLQKLDAREYSKGTHKQYTDEAKVDKIYQRGSLWAGMNRASRNVQNGTVTRGTNVDAKNFRKEATYDKTKGMYKYGDEGIGGMKDYIEDRVANKTVTRGESVENKEHKEIDMAKEDKMYQKETIWAGMNRVDRLMDSKSSLADSNSTSKGVNFVNSEILKLKV